MWRTATAALALAASLAGSAAHTHGMPNSTVVVAATADGFDAEVSIPQSELEAALGRSVSADDVRRHALERYLREHVAVEGADGKRWPMGIMEQRLDAGDHPAVRLRLRFPTPPDAPARGARLRYDLVNHRIASHYVLVYRRTKDGLEPLGRLQAPELRLPLP